MTKAVSVLVVGTFANAEMCIAVLAMVAVT